MGKLTNYNIVVGNFTSFKNPCNCQSVYSRELFTNHGIKKEFDCKQITVVFDPCSSNYAMLYCLQLINFKLLNRGNFHESLIKIQ